MCKKFIIVFLFVNSIAFSQQKAVEAGIISDNDLYTSSVYDKYYTNGFELFYRYLDRNENEKISKKITEFRLGQYIYNPQTRNADLILSNDRPFAGYLFTEAGRNIFYRNESVLKMNIQLGYIGPNALGKEMQRAFHDVFGYKRVNGWQHQIKNALAVQGNAVFSKKISLENLGRVFDSHFNSYANGGTIWNGISIGILSRIGLKKLLPIYNSNLHGASVNADAKVYRDESEFYFYFEPRFTYQFYDATVQGSMFNNNSPVTFDLVPLRFQGEAGFKLRKNRWNVSYSFLYRGKEVDNRANKNYFYGSIAIGHLF